MDRKNRSTPDCSSEFKRPNVAARILDVSPKTLVDWRYKGTGPKYYKLNGKLIRYRIQDLLAYAESCSSGGGAA